MTKAVTVYISLVDEAVEVWKPFQANLVSDGKYIIIGDETDPDFDSLEFKPGETVVCEERMLSNGRVLVAVRLADC